MPALAVPAFPGMSMAPTRTASFFASGVVNSEMTKDTSSATAAATGAEWIDMIEDHSLTGHKAHFLIYFAQRLVGNIAGLLSAGPVD